MVERRGIMIGVIGHRGRLGSELVSRGFEVIDCDITDPKSIQSAIDGKNYDAIINCAAYTNVDKAEQDRIRVYAVNSFGPQNIAKVYKGYIIQLSSDYIFSGLEGPYTETHFASPLGAYGFSKHMGEVGLSPYMDRVLVVRTTILYDIGPKLNFVLAVYNQLKEGKIVKAPKTLRGNATYVPHLADGIIDAINKKLTGVLNIAGETIKSRYELAREIAIFFRFDPSNVISAPAWGDARRPERCGLDLTKAKRLGIPLYTLWEGLDAFDEKLNPRQKDENEEIAVPTSN